MGDVAIAFGCGDEDEGLTADASDGENRNDGRGRSAPGDAGLDQLLIAKILGGAWDFSFGQDALQAVVDLRREKADGGLDEDVAGGVEDIYGQARANLRGALCGDVDVGLEIGVLVDGGENGGGGDVVAEVDGDVADHTVERGADVVVGELFLLGDGESGVAHRSRPWSSGRTEWPDRRRLGR